MTSNRWNELMYNLGTITSTETLDGWHFCEDWDFFLIGPGDKELAGCHCLPKNHSARQNKFSAIPME
jgi:hypothetical protein